MGLKTYMLVRVGLNVREEEWFGLDLEEEKETSAEQEDRGEQKASSPEPGRFCRLRRPFGRMRDFQRRRKAMRAREEQRRRAQQERKLRQQEREERIRRTEESIRRLFEEITELAGETRGWQCVYDSSVRKAVAKDTGILPLLWKKYCEAEEFDGYLQGFWMEQVLSRADLKDYVILGNCSGIYELLEKRAPGIRSLRWLVPEAEYDEELAEFAEDFYIEYGLAIELRTFQSEAAFRQLRLDCSSPVNILDFTKDLYFPRAEAAEGSIWLDMLSREEKRYQITGRQKGIRYDSLKERWKHAKRRCRAPEIIPEERAESGETNPLPPKSGLP